MAYFAPYIDGTGIHLPTYEDRLADFCEGYRSIVGTGAELSAAVPDYQIMSVFAKALDDCSALALQAYNARNPQYATGANLAALAEPYGITGDTDAQIRAALRDRVGRQSNDPENRIVDAVMKVNKVREAVLYVNNTDATDDKGIPAHSVAVVTRGGQSTAAIAQAIFDSKPPGIGTYGSSSADAVDAEGNTHSVSFSRYSDRIVFVYPYISVLDGGDQTLIGQTVCKAMADYVNNLGIGVGLNIPQLYGVAYTANPDIAGTFIITDLQVFAMGTSALVRDSVSCAWNQKITVVEDGGVSIHWNT